MALFTQSTSALLFMLLACCTSLTFATSQACQDRGPHLPEDEVSLLQVSMQPTVMNARSPSEDHADDGSLFDSEDEEDIVHLDETSTTTPIDNVTKRFGEMAKLSKIKLNAPGDLPAMLASLKTYVGAFVFMVAVFTVMQYYYPQLYGWRATHFYKEGETQADLDAVSNSEFWPSPLAKRWDAEKPTFFGWIKRTCTTNTQEIEDTCGLDAAMLLQFTELAMELLGTLSIPLVLLFMPMYAFGGGGFADKDRLSWPGVGNVIWNSTDLTGEELTQDQKDMQPYVQWIFFVMAFMVWVVVVWVQARIFSWQRAFIDRRTKWLLRLPTPRSTTIMVEGIERMQCTDDALTAFFQEMFGKDSVESAFIVKKTMALERLIATYDSYKESVDDVKSWLKANPGKAEPTVRGTGKTQTDYYEELMKIKADEITEEQQRIKEQAKVAPEDQPFYDIRNQVYSYTGFVTFSNRKIAEQVLTTRLSESDDSFYLSVPPEPSDVLYDDLYIAHGRRVFMAIIGYALLVALFFAFMPIVLAIAQLTANIEDIDFLKKIIAATGMADTIRGVLASMGLTIMMSMLPTFLMWIFRACFVLKADRWAQLTLQEWYFWFLVVFVLLTTAIGTDLSATMQQLIDSPTAVFSMLASKLPVTTHFYMTYILLQPVTHGMNLTRYISVIKYYMFKYAYSGDWERARAACEPEDQDYYGIGSRSARFSLILLMGLVFGTICPLINLFCLYNFAVCRLVYGYLIPYQEDRKSDLGGNAWVMSLHHLSIGILIYIVLMTGILLQRAQTMAPAVISGVAFVWWILSYMKFRTQLRWEGLAFQNVVQYDKGSKASHASKTGFTYGQKELQDKYT